MQYATVSLLTLPDSTLGNGIITDKNGQFKVGTSKAGSYILRINFIGYQTYYVDVILNAQNPVKNIGTVVLGSSSVDMDAVTVTANERAVEYKIDRKVVHVGEQYSALSGTAVDILQSVPSIDVDIENNVAIRGNSNFTVLIDGRPSVLEGNEALQQIPAGMIQNIEIITNPSAKFDPEGTGGIINIITKKRKITGLNGIIHANVGLDDKYGGDVLLNYRTKKFNFFGGIDYNERNYPGSVERRQETYSDDTVKYLNAEGDYNRARKSYSGRAGFEWFPDDKNTISLSGRYGYRLSSGMSTTEYEEWTNFSPAKTTYTNLENSMRGGNFYAINSDYTHNFNGTNAEAEDHRLDVHFMFYSREGEEESLNYLLDKDTISDGQKSTENGPGKGINYRINYEQAFTKLVNIEIGTEGRIRESNESNGLYFYDAANDIFLFQSKFSNDVTYTRNINGIYGLLRGEFRKLGYQLGFRGEYTFRDVNMNEQGTFNINRWDYFPTLHMSYQFNENNQMMASYSRRIDRPRGWYLEPFITWSNAFNVRRGNPDLQPEYIGSYELGYQRNFGEASSVSAEMYYRVTDNKIEEVEEVYRDNIRLSTRANVGTDYALGTEIMLNTDFTEWWQSDISGNFYNYRVKGDINGEALDRESFTWSVEWNSIFKIAENTRIQINPEFDSREIEAQETESATFEVDGAVRQSFLDNNLSVTLQVRDIFNTDRHESETEGRDFHSYRLYLRRAPIVMLNITWRINNYRNDGGNGSMGEGGGDEGGEM